MDGVILFNTLAAACGIATALYAGSKGYNPVLWGVLGFLTLVLGAVGLAVLPTRGPKVD